MLSVVMRADPLMQLRKSRFRSNFGLSEFEKQKIREAGILSLFEQSKEIIINKLNNPILDGRQTPFYGSPIFKAMHATACCCRKCLFKWHRIPPHRELNEDEISYIQDLIYRWIRKQMYTKNNSYVAKNREKYKYRVFKNKRIWQKRGDYT